MNFKGILIFFIFAAASSLLAQVDLSAGMGIDFSSNPSLYDFLNTNYKRQGNELNFFDSNVEFYVEAGIPVKPDYELAAEYNYSLYSYNSNNGYELSYNMHSITLSAYYVLKGKGYKLKFGGGAGYRHMYLLEKFNNSYDFNYGLNGAGLQFKADGNTSLGGNFYANIAVALKLDYLGKPKSTILIQDNENSAPISNVKFFIISPGIRLGVSYFF